MKVEIEWNALVAQIYGERLKNLKGNEPRLWLCEDCDALLMPWL